MYRLKLFFFTFLIVTIFYVIMNMLGWGDIVSAIFSSLNLGLFYLFAISFLLIAVFIKRDYFFSRGYNLIRKCQYEMAINEFIKETEDNQKKASLYCGLGYCHFMLGYNKNSIKNYEIALELEPNLIEAYFMLAILYAEERKIAVAFDFIAKGKVFQRRGSIINRLSKFQINEYEGWVYHLNDDEESAFKFYDKAMPGLNRLSKKVNMKYHERFSSLSFRMGVIYKLKGDIEKAKEKYEQSIKASPPSIFAEKSQKELDLLAKEARSMLFKDLM